MNKIIAVAFFMLSSLAFASNTGHIHFQADSTWVNPVTNKSLCYKNGMFYAKVVTCLETRMVRGTDECSKWGKKMISQAANSSRMVCLQEVGENGRCVQYGMVDYNQSRDRDVTYSNDRGADERSETVTVASCK